jgi:hypothetical protein
VVEEFVDYTMPEKPGLLGQSGENKTNDANKPQSMAKGLATLFGSKTGPGARNVSSRKYA